MSLDIKRAIAMPFKGTRSQIALAIGALLSLPSAYVTTHAGAPGMVQALAYLVSLVFIGYQVRIMRSQMVGSYHADPAVMPAWGGDPTDMIMSVIADFIGAVLFSLAFTGILLVSWLLLGAFGLAGAGLGGLAHVHSGEELIPLLMGAVGGIGVLITIALVIPAVCFGVMMLAHYAHEDRIGAVLEWRTIWRITSTRFWRLFGFLLLSGIIVGLVEGVAGLAWPVLAVVSFACSCMLGNLYAQAYVARRGEG